MPSLLRVLIADDDPDLASALTLILERLGGMTVVGVAENPDEVAKIAARERPDVALVDVVMPGGGGLRALRKLRSASPSTAPLIHSGADDGNAVLEMLRSGALGFIQKGSDPMRLIAAIESVARGDLVISSSLAHAFSKQIRRGRENDESTHSGEVTAIERCLSGNRFRLFFQPIVDLRTLKPVAYEALTRFDDGPTDAWFKMAWRTGRGPELETRACEHALALLPKMPDRAGMTINLSPDTLSYRPARELLESIDGQLVTIEITEHAVIDEPARLQRDIAALRELGIRIALDDAGAGLANFVRMRQIVPDLIKLDRALVEDIDRDPIKTAVVRSLVAFATDIGADVIGEGIERGAEAETVRSLGATLGQGFLFGRPRDLTIRMDEEIDGPRASDHTAT